MIHFIAVGPQKTGTTWLYQLLYDHSQICFPKNVKETMFFDLYYEKGISRYQSYFKHQKLSQKCGEVAPSYFDVDEVSARIWSVAPKCKIIITLRSPISRTFSLYCHHLRKGRVPQDFSKAIQTMPRILDSGHYAKHIPKWLDNFGKEQVHFVLMDDIKIQPEIVLAETCYFLNISTPELFSEKELNQKVNQASMPKFPILAKAATQAAGILRASKFDQIVEFGKKLGLKRVYRGGEDQLPQITDQEAQFLSSHYEDDIQYVEQLLGRSLPQWRTH